MVQQQLQLNSFESSLTRLDHATSFKKQLMIHLESTNAKHYFTQNN